MRPNRVHFAPGLLGSARCREFVRGFALSWLTFALAVGCGFHSDIAALGRLRAEIQRQIGTDSAITVHTSEGATTVTVRLAHLPAADSMQVQARVEALAKAEFPKTNYVVVVLRQ